MLRLFPAWTCTAVMIFFACSSALAEQNPVRVGVTLPLTGAFSEYGAAMKNAILLAQEEQPEVKASLVFSIEDDRYLPKHTLDAFNKLVTVDKIDLIYVWGNEPALAIAPVAEKRRFPAMLMAQHPAAGKGYRYVMRFINPAEDYSRKMMEYLRSQGVRKIAVVKAEFSHANILVQALEQNIRPAESLTVIESFSPEDNDFRTAILRLKKQRYDALGLYLVPPQLIQFFRQAGEQNCRIQAFGTTPFESQSLIEQTAGLIEGSVYTHNSLDQAFRARYARRFGNDSQIAYAANIYDFAVLTAELLGALKTDARSAEPIAAEQILDAYRLAGERTGVTGKFRFKETPESGKYFEFPVVVKKITSGKIEVLPD